jgi:ParB family chromosome partitioning protein
MAEIESFRLHGQVVPVLGRVLRGDPDHDVELIYGARRLFVARHINRPLLVDLRDISDKEAIRAMDIENRQRVDISPYERGLSFARWLRGGHFSTQTELARALNVSPSVVSRLLQVARVPTVVVNAFEDPRAICESWGIKLMQPLDDADKRAAIVREARLVVSESPRRAPEHVYRRLLAAAAKGRRLSASRRDEVVRDKGGGQLFRIKYRRDSISFVVAAEKISTQAKEAIRSAVAEILEKQPTPVRAWTNGSAHLDAPRLHPAATNGSST